MRTIVLERYDLNKKKVVKVIRRPDDWPGPNYPYVSFGIGSLVRLEWYDVVLWRVCQIGQGRGKKPLKG